MSQDINKIINELAEIDSASAKIMQQSLNEKAKYADYINQQKSNTTGNFKWMWTPVLMNIKNS
ncbi:MAG: hypothetical protein ACLVFL_07010 [Eubacterium sp.]